MRFSEFADRILSIFFPKRCAYCGKLIVPSGRLCVSCEKNLPRIEPPLCLFCGHSKADCRCRQKKFEFKAVAAPFYYEGAVKEAVRRLKFKNLDFVAETLAADMERTVRREYEGLRFDCVTFVPFSEADKKRREFNQSALLARELAKRLGLPCADLLQKIYDVPPQHTLKRGERAGNVFGVFGVKEGVDVRGLTVLLADDIKTTGATLSECAKMLKLAGANAVYAAAAAVTKLSPGTRPENQKARPV